MQPSSYRSDVLVILQLKVTLRGVRPPIWRRLEIASSTTLLELHHVLQGAMGWSNCHLHLFAQNGVFYGAPDRESGLPMRSEGLARVCDLLPAPRARLIYEYDFGDGWVHDVVVEARGEAQPDARYPRVTAGKRACPPEDVGGAYGYAALLEALADPTHDDHGRMIEWLGDAFDPDRFDVVSANDRLPTRQRVAHPDALLALALLLRARSGSTLFNAHSAQR